MNGESCCFLGHRSIEETDELKTKLRQRIEELITAQNVDKFVFGSKSRFNDLCYETVTAMKKKGNFAFAKLLFVNLFPIRYCKRLWEMV